VFKYFFEENIFKKVFNLNSLFNIEVVTLHGLIYVMDGMQDKKHNNSVEIYNPKTNTWKSIESPIKGRGTYSAAVVIDRPPYL